MGWGHVFLLNHLEDAMQGLMLMWDDLAWWWDTADQKMSLVNTLSPTKFLTWHNAESKAHELAMGPTVVR